MLRNEILIWIMIAWVMCTCIIALDLYVRIEDDKATKRMEAIAQEMAPSYIPSTPEPVVPSTINEPESYVEIKAVETKTYFDVPMAEEFQDHIFELCEKNNVDPALVVAMIGKESVYNVKAIGDGGNSLGLMQIQPRWHYERMEKLGCSDLLDPYQNVMVGIDILAELFATGKSTEWVLMAYNGGRSYANEKTALGIVSDYANTIMTNARTLNTYTVVKEG